MVVCYTSIYRNDSNLNTHLWSSLLTIESAFNLFWGQHIHSVSNESVVTGMLVCVALPRVCLCSPAQQQQQRALTKIKRKHKTHQQRATESVGVRTHNELSVRWAIRVGCRAHFPAEWIRTKGGARIHDRIRRNFAKLPGFDASSKWRNWSLKCCRRKLVKIQFTRRADGVTKLAVFLLNGRRVQCQKRGCLRPCQQKEITEKRGNKSPKNVCVSFLSHLCHRLDDERKRCL